MEPPPSLSGVLDDENENQEELIVLKELYDVRCTLRGEALVKFDFLMDSLKEKDESIEELEYHLNEKERRFNLLRQELKTERCISQGLKQQIETYELDKVKDLETIDRAQSLTQVLHASKEELEVAHASLTRDLDHLERANKLVKDELKKLGENHDLLQETYTKALESMKDPIVVEKLASSPTSFTSEHAKLVEEHVRLQEELSLHVETNAYLESLVTKYGLNYHPNESSCEQASILEENVRLTKELAKFTTAKNKMGLDDLLSKQRSNNQKFGLGYVSKSHKKKNYNKEKPAQNKNKKVTNNGKATSGDRTGPNDHYTLFVDYYGDVYANYVGPPNGYAYRGYSIWGYSSGGPKWVFDSGCTNHMTGGRGVLDQFIEDINKKSSITFGDNSKGKVLGYGKVAISKDLCLETVMLVESLGYNLLSIYHLADAGYNSYFTNYCVMVFRSDNLKLVLVGYVENNLYVVDLSKESSSHSTCLMATKHDEGWLWHRRLGHVNMRNLKQLLKGEHIVGLTGISFEKDRVCSACVAGKQLKKKHPIKSIVTTSRPLELLHLDLFGPSHYDTLGGSKYGLVIVDDYSRYSWVFLLKSKDETHREFIIFAKKAQRMYESEIKAIRTDNGTEFKNYTMQEFVDDEGIKHEFSAPYTPQQNGVVERKNRTIIEMARTMLSEFNSPHNFWGEAISTPSTTPTGSSSVPSTTKLHTSFLPVTSLMSCTFVSLDASVLLRTTKESSNSHAYRYYNRSTGTIEVSCDVEFLEDNGSQVEQVVPCVAGNDDDPSSAIKHMGIGHIRPIEVHNDDGVEVSSTAQVEPSSTQAEPSSATQEPSSTQDESHSEEQEESPHSIEQDHDDDQETSTTHDQAQVIPHDQVLARDEFIDHEGTIRKIKAATRASDMKVDQVLGSISRGVVTRRHHALLITYCQHHAFVSSFEPLKVHEALVDPDWVIAMQEELECFTRNEVWSLVERPKDHRINVIGTKWVFKNKQDENGIVIRNKARKFEMSMMGELKFFLGFQVRQLAKGTFISQEKYVKDMLKKFNMTNASPMKTPMPVKGQLGSCDGLHERDIFDLFLPEFDKLWVIHLRETCCCSTNLALGGPTLSTRIEAPVDIKLFSGAVAGEERMSFQDKTLLDTSCSGSFTRNKEEFKWDLLNRIQENAEDWENDKGKESGYADKPPFKPLPPKEGNKKKGTKKKKKKKKENKKKEVTAYPRVNEITLGNRKYVAPNDYCDNESEYDDLPMPFTYISDHDLNEHTTFDITNLWETNSENDDNNCHSVSAIHASSHNDIESSKLGEEVFENPFATGHYVLDTSPSNNNDGSWSGEGRGTVAKRGQTGDIPSRRSSGRVPSQAHQGTDIGSSAGGRTKSVGGKKKDKHAAQEDDEIVPTFNVGNANRVEWQEMRTVNPYRFEQRTYTRGDKFFWTKTQAALWDGFYDSHEFMKNGDLVMPKAINPDELALHEATKYRFVVETLKGMGLYDLVCLKPDDEQEDPTFCPLLVRQFHCTVFFHDDADRTITWMTGKEKYSCTYSQFRAAMGCDGDSAPGYKIHSRSKLTKGDISFCYPANPTPGPPTISGMYYSYLVLAKMFRESLISKSGDTSEVRNYHLNLMYYCHPDRVRKIDGCDLIHCELKRAVMDRMTPNYAQYVQRLINYIVPAPLNTLGERVIMDPFRIPTQEATRPDVPSMMPSTERRSKEHHDHDASSSYSRCPKHGAARFFSSMWQMCKNTNDVAHQSLTVNQETRRRQNEFMASRNHPVPPSGPEMEPVVAP
ncbi:hypothetical protein QYE76_021642 [Lolium multiflorum]|uniref:Integrase catalytic domain-containing protein n=1 Tax=Lolium multiflorum TaxID=4521 RepID=A0AAD8R756_LOLMU|nr:hypothetical protein QYE76_021642 [Lolium multiflorum]